MSVELVERPPLDVYPITYCRRRRRSPIQKRAYESLRKVIRPMNWMELNTLKGLFNLVGQSSATVEIELWAILDSVHMNDHVFYLALTRPMKGGVLWGWYKKCWVIFTSWCFHSQLDEVLFVDSSIIPVGTGNCDQASDTRLSLRTNNNVIVRFFFRRIV